MTSKTKWDAFDKELAEKLCNLQVPKKIQISPDGQKVVYSAGLVGNQRTGKNTVSTLWLAETSKANSSRKLTSGKSNDSNPQWHPDSNRIAFVSDRAKPGESSAIWMLRLDGGDAEAITPAENERSISTFAISPDGTTIAYVSVDEKDEDKKKREKENLPDPKVWGENWEYARLRLVDIESKEVKTLVGDERHIENVAWSSDSKRIAFTSAKNPDIEETPLSGTEIGTVSVESQEISHVCATKSSTSQLTWEHSGRIVFLSGVPDGYLIGGPAVYAVDPTVESPKYTRVACGEDDHAASLALVGGKALVNCEVRMSTAIRTLDGKELFVRDTEMLVWDVHTDNNGNSILAVSLSDVNSPCEVYTVQDGRNDIQLSNHGEPFQGREFGTSTVLTSQSSDGDVELDALYVTPAAAAPGQDGKPSKPLPTFVYVHGGPSARACSSFRHFGFYWSTYLLCKGYGILIPQYRGSTGRGEKFSMYSKGGQGKYDHADVLSITDDAVKKGYADKAKLLVGGWSQGGLISYISSVRNGLQDLGWKYQAAIAGAGITDVEGFALTSDLGSTYQTELNAGNAPWMLSRENTSGRQGSAIWQVGEAMEESKKRGEPVIPPMLILHGEEDKRVPFSQAEGFRRALRAHNLPCEFVSYPGQAHSMAPQSHWLDSIERVHRWCDTYIGPGLE